MDYIKVNKIRNSFAGSLMILLAALFFTGCYGFTSGTVPEHLKTIYIANIEDNSGYGDPENRDLLTRYIVDEFRNDNTFSLVDRGGDAKIYIKIKSIRDNTVTLSPGELETERKIEIRCHAEYYDAVKKKTIWRQDFSNSQLYELASEMTARKEAIDKALGQISEDILFAVVSDW